MIDVSVHDGVEVVVLSFVAALVSYAIGTLLMRVARRRAAVGAAAIVVALIPVASFAAGVIVAARAMFVSSHDSAVLAIIVLGAGTAGVLGALALARELVAARREAEAATERERLLEHSRRELVAWVSHDLRTPLAGIRAMAEALDDGVVDDPATTRRYHRQLVEETGRLAHLVNDLFELSRIHAEALQLSFERVSLRDLVSDAIAAVEVIAEAKGVHVDGRVEAPVRDVSASARELSRVVGNLLDNAIRHTPPGGAVIVEVHDTGREAVVSVRDECGGIAQPDLERVFELAYRGDEARTPGGGAGLGLAIAHGFVAAHDGRIQVRNEEGGCRFTIRLPVGPRAA
jgi:signal transduction histidine kinase